MPHFPDLTPLIAHLSPYEQDFARKEFGFGLDYYLKRLDSLEFSGQRALDAGCGQGQWSVALAHRFAHVDAIDLKEERLGVLRAVAEAMGLTNIDIRKGSVDTLPYADASFDAVFCYGVIMFTDMHKVLAEFFRVLRPGGRLYVCCNGDGWNWYLVEERGKNNPALQKSARDILFDSHMTRARYFFFKNIPPFLRRRACIPLLTWCIRCALPFNHSPYINKLRRLGPEYLHKFAHYAAQALVSAPPTETLGISRSLMPHEVEAMLHACGFVQFTWSTEGDLLFHPQRTCAPRYTGHYGGELAVWEFCACRPAPVPAAQDVLAYVQQHQGLLPPEGTPPLLSANTPQSHYAPSLLLHWEAVAQRLGGDAFLVQLGAEATQDAGTERERFERLVSFVQRSLLRHPLFQPVQDKTAPSPLALVLSGMGRCGHCVQVLEFLLASQGFQTRRLQYPTHMSLAALVEERWVLAEADIFKHDVLPVNERGLPLGMDDIAREPRLLDCFPPTGWRFSPQSRHLATPWGQASGYIAAQERHHAGYISTYFSEALHLAPPATPQGLRLQEKEGQVLLLWEPSAAPSDPLRHYEVFVSTQSRGWQDDDDSDTMPRPLPCDVLHCTTTETQCLLSAPAGPLFASVKAVGMQSLEMPATFYWPSGEIRLASCTPNVKKERLP